MSRVVIRRDAWLVFALLLAIAPMASCGGGEVGQPHAPAGASAQDLDGDAIALLPAGAVAAATVDARALYANHAFGAQVVQVAEVLLPLGAEAGFVPSRDVDRVTVAWYAVTGADFVAVVRGRFDPVAIQKAADAHSAAHAGGVLAATPYSGHTMFTVADVGFSVLTPHTALAGTAAGLRLALDRIRDGRVRRELPPALTDTLDAKDAAFAFAGDFAASPLSGVQGLPMPAWVSGVKGARMTGAFHETRLDVSGSVIFGDPKQASAGADGMRQIGALVNTVALAGVVPELKNLDIAPDGSGVRVAFGVDETQLRRLLQQVPQWLPQRLSQPPGAQGVLPLANAH
jgi:hypothetical protein